MNKISASDKIYVSKSKIPGAGRGVFAKFDIKKGEIIEKCPTVQISKTDTALLVESSLTSYFYFLGKKKEKTYFVLGFGSIYNHSHKPNATYKARIKEKRVDFIASKDIKKEEEIVVNYDPENSKIPLWFKLKKVKFVEKIILSKLPRQNRRKNWQSPPIPHYKRNRLYIQKKHHYAK